MSSARVSQGVPAGGQFAATQRDEADIDLTSAPVVDQAVVTARPLTWESLADEVGEDRAEELRSLSGNSLDRVAVMTQATEVALRESKASRIAADEQQWDTEPGVEGRHSTIRNAHDIHVDDLGDRYDIVLHGAHGEFLAQDVQPDLDPGDSDEDRLADVQRQALAFSDYLRDAEIRNTVPEKTIGDMVLREMLGGQDPDSIEPPF